MLLWKAVRTGERKSFIWSSLTLFHLLELMDFWSTARFPFKSWQIVFPSSTHSMWNFNWWPSTQAKNPLKKRYTKLINIKSLLFEITMDRCVLVKTHHFLSNVKVAFCKWWHFWVVHIVTTLFENYSKCLISNFWILAFSTNFCFIYKLKCPIW